MEIIGSIAKFLVSSPEWLVVVVLVSLFLFYGERREQRGEIRDKAMLAVIKENSSMLGYIGQVLSRWDNDERKE